MKNLAFLSYSHHDAKVAKWLQSSLEHYQLPKGVTNPIDEDNRYLRPIFRDRTDLTTGVLSDVINSNLEKSEFLIILCSRKAAKSVWVSKEAQYFIEHGRMEKIIPLVVDGIPYSGGPRECMPIYMREYVKENPNKELLCIDMVAEGPNRAFMQVASRLLNVPFDVLYGRHRRRRNRLLVIQAAIGFVALCLGGFFVTPISSSVQVVDVMSRLPHQEGELMIDGKIYLVSADQYDTTMQVTSLPGYMRGRTLDVRFSAPFYDTIYSTIELGYGFHSQIQLQLKRDHSFSVFAGHVLDEDGMPIRGAYVRLGSFQAISDLNGYFLVSLPVEVQAEEQPILIQKDGYEEIVRVDECPSEELLYIMHPAKAYDGQSPFSSTINPVDN